MDGGLTVRDRFYTIHEEYIFQLYSVEPWMELNEKVGDIELNGLLRLPY